MYRDINFILKIFSAKKRKEISLLQILLQVSSKSQFLG